MQQPCSGFPLTHMDAHLIHACLNMRGQVQWWCRSATDREEQLTRADSTGACMGTGAVTGVMHRGCGSVVEQNSPAKAVVASRSLIANVKAHHVKQHGACAGAAASMLRMCQSERSRVGVVALDDGLVGLLNQQGWYMN
eukprot:365944-Chlamydomonas_euryale.AAC.4